MPVKAFAQLSTPSRVRAEKYKDTKKLVEICTKSSFLYLYLFFITGYNNVPTKDIKNILPQGN